MNSGIAAEALNHIDFKRVFDALIRNLFLKNRDRSNSVTIDIKDIRRATWLASLGSLGDENEKSIANAFGSLLYLYDPDNELFLKTCYILQSRSGNLVSSRHLNGLYKENEKLNSFGTSLDFELATHRFDLGKDFDGETIFFTHYQKSLWEKLESGKNIAVSAPTSAGKSFVIKRFIFEIIQNNKAEFFVYVVPSKALINQVSNELSKELKESALVLTTYREVECSDKNIVYVLTPERCMRLLQEKNNHAPLLVFFDEIQNIEDGTRGSVYENVIYRMTTRWKDSQFIMAGPYIENLHLSLREIIDIDLLEHKTVATPVLQLKTVLTVFKKSQNVKYKIISPTGSVVQGDYDIGRALYSKLSASRGQALKYLTSVFHEDEQNIIFSPKKNMAEGWALSISGDDEVNSELVDNEKIKNLCSFLESEIHPLYSLVRCIKKGVAFHHGGLLDVARLEIEDLFSSGVVKNLVCTSTLLQGVNLPADRIVVISPKIGNYNLSQFEFLNLIGRAGRINTSLYGEIFCIELCDEEWAEERIKNEDKKEIVSSVLNKLNENVASVINYIDLSGQQILDSDGDYKLYPLVSYLRGQYLVDKKHYIKIINNSKLNKEQIGILEQKLEGFSKKISIPDDLLARNPFVDPLLLSEFFELIKSQGVSEWMISKYPGGKRETRPLDDEFKNMNYYNQYKSIISRMNDIFNIVQEVNYKDDGKSWRYKYPVSISKLAYDSHNWMQGHNYKFFIDNMVKDKLTKKGLEINNKNIDRITNFVTAHINTNLNFILVKYLSLWADVVGCLMSEDEREKYKFFLNLPSMLEMGSYDPLVLEIMSFGINRSTAIELTKKQRIRDGQSVESYLRTYNIAKLSSLHRKYLEKAGFGSIK
ncbi:DEAD/DEAH box helicase [Escherichia coli]|uniref:DEAD/DEAH box helicase n=2 Tax=Escherichia coli TaxID=562 RepID=UPI001E54C7D5|nr:DEAD/DEAH box helicase [Escherichia coli]MCD6763398.1 DEAD/DEAH box helicase [Escherichia coli]HBP7861068.1 DEAD/DEAH box helicase [Escherichia coli]